MDFEQDSLDFWTKYGLILSNSLIISLLFVYNKFFRQEKDKNGVINRILLVLDPIYDDPCVFFPIMETNKEKYEFHIICFKEENINEKEFDNICFKMGIKERNLIEENNSQEFIYNYITKNEIKAIVLYDSERITNIFNNILQKSDIKNFPKDFLKVYELKNVGFVRRWLGIWDFFLCILEDFLYINLNILKLLRIQNEKNGFFSVLSRLLDRYTYINTLKRIK